MKRIINKELLKREWVLENWYEKVYYVTGMVLIWLWLISFIAGFIAGVLE